MTKDELIEKMAKESDITKAAAGKAYDSFLEGIKGWLKKRDSKETLVGFGTSKKKYIEKPVKAGILKQVNRSK